MNKPTIDTTTTECEHLDFDNVRDCENEAKYMCMCCGAGACEEHAGSNCEYGGMGYIDL